MRLPFALAAATAYALGRPAPALHTTPKGPIVEPWRPSGIPDDPDPIAAFLLTHTRAEPGARTPVGEVLNAYALWSRENDQEPAPRIAATRRIYCYATLCRDEAGAIALADRVLIPRGEVEPTPLCAIPNLRTRALENPAELAAELLTTLQATREVLEPATDEPGLAGDAVRTAAAMLDDQLADAAL